MNKFDYIKSNNFYSSKNTAEGIKMQPTEQEKLFSSELSP